MIGDSGSAALDFYDASKSGFHAYWTLKSTVGPIQGYDLYLTLNDGKVYHDSGLGLFGSTVSGEFTISAKSKTTYRGTLSGTAQILTKAVKILPATASITTK